MDDTEFSNSDQMVSNGIDASDGEYLSVLTPEQVAALVLGEEADPRYLKLLRQRDFEASEKKFGVRKRGAADDLGYTGWGLVFGQRGPDPKILEALKPLIDLRRSQAKDRYRECSGKYAYRPGLSAIDYAAELGAGPGDVDPKKAPYYLLIVGGPDEVPFQVQCELDAQFAVGRVCFETPEEYCQYARAVEAAEAATPKRPQDLQARFVGTRNGARPGNPAKC